jgi:ATP-binding cassette subfamily B protein
MVLVFGVFVYQFDWRYGAVLILTLAAYFTYTTAATNWRIAIRRQMNESDTDANQKAIDSLLNYETVKYFSAERREAERYDKSMIHYEKASTHSYVSLAVLNAGQTVIYIIGVTIMMTMCVYGVRAGQNTIGDFVLINAMMIQLSQPLNFMRCGRRSSTSKRCSLSSRKVRRSPIVRMRPRWSSRRVVSFLTTCISTTKLTGRS